MIALPLPLVQSELVDGCDRKQLADAERQLHVNLPATLRSLYLSADGRFRADGEWWVVWPLDRLVAENIRAWADGTLDETLLAFGDDGTGDPFCSVKSDAATVVRWSVIAHEVEAELTWDTFKSEWLSA